MIGSASFSILGKTTASISYSQDVSVIYKADTIYFYGYDFAHFTFAEDVVVNAPGRYIFPWINYINSHFPFSEMEKWMKTTIIQDFSFTNKINKEIVDNLSMMAINASSALTEDSIQAIISNYDLKQKDGIGLVALMEYVNKAKEETLVQFVFFDIKTKKHIKTYESLVYGGNGIGFTKHWGRSFVKNLDHLIRSYHYHLRSSHKSEWKRKKKRIFKQGFSR